MHSGRHENAVTMTVLTPSRHPSDEEELADAELVAAGDKRKAGQMASWLSALPVKITGTETQQKVIFLDCPPSLLAACDWKLNNSRACGSGSPTLPSPASAQKGS